MKVNIKYLISCLILLSCSTVKFRPTENILSPLKESDNVYILTPNEQAPLNSIEIGSWEQVEDWDYTWERLIDKLEKQAASHGANIIKIEEYFEGSKTKGHAALLRGKFYSASNIQELEAFIIRESGKNTSDCNCSLIHVFRDEGNAGLRALFKISVVMNDFKIDDLTNRSTYTFKLTKEEDIFIGTSKPENFLFRTEIGKEYYIQATQNMGSSNVPGVIGVSIGSKEFFVDSTLKAKIHFETLEKYSH
ncbi:MAG: hypothetical protein ABIN36_12965 [Ferruginibacter sp.]